MSDTRDPVSTEWRRPRATRLQRRHDALGALVVFACMMPSAVLYRLSGAVGHDSPMWFTVVWAAVMCGTLAFRRRWPSITALVVAAAYIAGVELGASELLFSQIVLFVAMYTVGAWVSDRRVVRFTLGAITGAMLIWLAVAMFMAVTTSGAHDDHNGFGTETAMLAYFGIQVITNLLYFGGAAYFGAHAFRSARQRAELEYRTHELEQERERSAAQAVALERVRIARELHDVVAHHVSVMGVQAGAARTVMDVNPQAARDSLANIEQNARTAIDELHHLVGTLREGDAEEEASASASTIDISQLDELIAASSAAGLATSFDVLGEHRQLAGTVSLTLFRIAQEALTNARKYAGADATADVRLRYLDSAVELEIANTGIVPVKPRAGGLGHLGMRERIAAVGGEIEIGPRSRGGYLVRARIPLSTPVAASASSGATA
ncbi:sensor histidine kinase [Paramicrobacterium agarici]|uniref:sensor histidine kinase n=1 Tax=Paramicrobacterium agarici TaxID=630514 RepID=UPI0011523803|nr:sensor histidine kinase [Microbacterium agarici]TQO23323.1 signal transduction histidine kinase [Microbacterium agarici]